jgi:hypothetical protein
MPEGQGHDSGELLRQLEAEEAILSQRRRRLHRAIDFKRHSGNADGTPATPEQLASLDEEERAISAQRRALHAQIDELRRQTRP